MGQRGAFGYKGLGEDGQIYMLILRGHAFETCFIKNAYLYFENYFLNLAIDSLSVQSFINEMLELVFWDNKFLGFYVSSRDLSS